MQIGTRIIFGPPRGYTTSIYNYFKNNQQDKFFTHRIKEEEQDFDTFLNGYTEDKIYIDCSVNIFKTYLGPDRIFDFENEYFIYNVRDFDKVCFSNFLIGFIKESSLKNLHERVLLDNSIKFIIDELKNTGYRGKIHFVKEQDYNLNTIFDSLQIEHDYIEIGRANTSKQLIRNQIKLTQPFYGLAAYREFCSLYREELNAIQSENEEILRSLR